MPFDLGQILNVIKNASTAVDSAIRTVNDIRESGLVMSDASEEQIEAAISELEAKLPALRERVQNKLRGT